MKRLPSEKDNRGFTLLEVLVAIGVLAFGLLAVGSMQVTSIRQNAHSDRVMTASVLARDRLEKLMALTFSADSTDSGLTAGSNYSDPNAPDGYTVRWVITDGCSGSGCLSPPDTKLIRVTVASGRLHKNIVLMNIKPMAP